MTSYCLQPVTHKCPMLKEILIKTETAYNQYNLCMHNTFSHISAYTLHRDLIPTAFP